MRGEIESELQTFVFENLIFAEEGISLSDEESLLAQGAIDSTGIMELVDFVSSRFNLEVPVKDINQNNFDSITRLANYVRRRQSERPASDRSSASVVTVGQPAV